MCSFVCSLLTTIKPTLLMEDIDPFKVDDRSKAALEEDAKQAAKEEEPAIAETTKLRESEPAVSTSQSEQHIASNLPPPQRRNEPVRLRDDPNREPQIFVCRGMSTRISL